MLIKFSAVYQDLGVPTAGDGNVFSRSIHFTFMVLLVGGEQWEEGNGGIQKGVSPSLGILGMEGQRKGRGMLVFICILGCCTREAHVRGLNVVSLFNDIYILINDMAIFQGNLFPIFFLHASRIKNQMIPKLMFSTRPSHLEMGVFSACDVFLGCKMSPYRLENTTHLGVFLSALFMLWCASSFILH